MSVDSNSGKLKTENLKQQNNFASHSMSIIPLLLNGQPEKFRNRIHVHPPSVSFLLTSLCGVVLGVFDDTQRVITVVFFSETHYTYERMMKKHYNKEGGKAQSCKRREGIMSRESSK